MSNYLDFGIYIYLSTGKVCSAKFLAEKFEVSKKTIYRHVDNLVFAGVPIATSFGKYGGIKIQTDKLLNINHFSTNEIEFLQSLITKNTCKKDSEMTMLLSAKFEAFLNNRNNLVS